MISKTDIIAHIQGLLEEKIVALNQHIKDTQDSQKNDTKSSAGDKFETGREMLQAELNKYEGQRANMEKSLEILLSVHPNQQSEKVEFGSLIKTHSELYFIAIGLGKIKVNNSPVLVISLASPIGRLLHHKKVGDTIHFQGNEMVIKEIH